MGTIETKQAEGRATAERRRRMIVDVLAADAPHALNTDILRAVLKGLGERAGREETEGHAEWLAGAGLVEFTRKDPIMVVRITDRGRELAAGHIEIEGVAPPSAEGSEGGS